MRGTSAEATDRNLGIGRPWRATLPNASAMALIAVLLIVQIWLLSATLESFLAGNHKCAMPGCRVSMVLWLRPRGDPVHRSPVPHDQAIH